MKLPYFVHYDKSKLEKPQDKNFTFESNVTHSYISYNYSRLKPPISVTPNITLTRNSVDYVKTKVLDKVKGFIDWNLPVGNICVGGNAKEISFITSYFLEKTSIPVQMITPLELDQVSLFKASPLRKQSVLCFVSVNTDDTSPEFVYKAASKCIRSFLFRPYNMMVFCPSSGVYRTNGYASRIISSFAAAYGEDKVVLLENMYAANENEFIELGDGDPRIRRLPKNRKSGNIFKNPCKMWS